MKSTESRTIPLSGKHGEGKFAIVDAADYEWLTRYSWSLAVRGYPSAMVAFSDGSRRKICMHRLLIDLPPGMVTDHINRDRLDNRRCNLRVVTHRENRLNSSQYAPGPRPGYRRGESRQGEVGRHMRRDGLPTGSRVWSQRRRDGSIYWRGFIDSGKKRTYVPNGSARKGVAEAVLALYIKRYGALPPTP